nr:FAD-dependent oxidoreductase [Candidatus Sigynarchaeota archaeon]
MNVDSVFDIIVVGAGPAGLSCGIHAAEKGLKVLVLERAEAIGDKNSSGCALSPKCWRDFLFMSRLIDEVPHRATTLATMHFIDDQRRETSSISYSASKRFAAYQAAKDFLTMNVYRKDLDTWLEKLAREKGAIIKTSATVTAIKPAAEKVDGTIPCKDVEVNESVHYFAPLIIGSDGVFSQVCKSEGLQEKWRNNDLALMVTIDYQAAPSRIDEFYGDATLHYFYGANFPIGYVFFNHDGFHVGLGHYISWFTSHKISPSRVLEEFLSTPSVQRIIKIVEGKPREFQAHCVPFVSSPRQTHGDGFLVLGDAAGLICPLEAEGVYYAMVAGKSAAEVAVEARAARDYSYTRLSKYGRLIKDGPIGREFISGEMWKEFIDTVPFNVGASGWVNQLLPDALFAALNVSEPHSETVDKRAHERGMVLARIIYPKVKKIASKPLVSVLDEFLMHYLDKLNISVLMKPLLESTRGMREKIIQQVLDDWLSAKKTSENIEPALQPLSERLPQQIHVDLRAITHVKKSSRPIITHVEHRCTNCGSCTMICPEGLWHNENGHVSLERDHESWCTECGGCFQACPASAILMQLPLHGEGVKYMQG